MGDEDTGSKTATMETAGPATEGTPPDMKPPRPAGRGKESHPGRSFVAWLLIVLGCLCAISGTAALWMKVTALDTDTFVGTVAPLIQNDAVAKAVSAEAVQILLEQEDVQGKIEGVLPSELQFLAEPATGGVEAVLEKVAEEILKSGAFQAVWRETLRQAHATAVAVLTGDGEVKVTRQGEVVLDLNDLVNELKDRLVSEGVEELEDVRIDEEDASVVLFTSDELGAAKTAVDILELLAWVLPVLALVFFAGAILIAWDRRAIVMGAGAALALTMALELVLLAVSKSQLLGEISDAGVRAAANVIWDSLFSGLIWLNVGLLIAGAVAFLVAVLAGPYGWAKKLRGLFSRKEAGSA